MIGSAAVAIPLTGDGVVGFDFFADDGPADGAVEADETRARSRFLPSRAGSLLLSTALADSGDAAARALLSIGGLRLGARDVRALEEAELDDGFGWEEEGSDVRGPRAWLAGRSGLRAACEDEMLLNTVSISGKPSSSESDGREMTSSRENEGCEDDAPD